MKNTARQIGLEQLRELLAAVKERSEFSHAIAIRTLLSENEDQLTNTDLRQLVTRSDFLRARRSAINRPVNPETLSLKLAAIRSKGRQSAYTGRLIRAAQKDLRDSARALDLRVPDLDYLRRLGSLLSVTPKDLEPESNTGSPNGKIE